MLTYKAPDAKPAEAPPDPVAIAAKSLETIVPRADPRNTSVSPIRHTPQGWSFCLTTVIGGSTDPTPRKATFWVTVLTEGVYDRRRAEPADRCDGEQFARVSGG